MRTFRSFLFVLMFSVLASPVFAAVISGTVSDSSGGAVPSARVTLRQIASGQETVVETDARGAYRFDVPNPGSYLVIVSRPGFSEAARTVIIDSAEGTIDVPFSMELGVLTDQVTVTASRAEREVRQIPLHVETLSGVGLEQSNPTSTGDALSAAVNVTAVGNGPFGVRPRLRGLDSTRMLVLVDGERLNTARQATDRTGAEVGLIPTDSISRVEIINGAGTLMYGSDALAGTINIITNETAFSDRKRLLYGFNGFYSSNENGRRGTLTFGTEGPRVSIRVQGGSEQYDSYTAGKIGVEDTNPYFTSGQIKRTDTIDTNFGFNVKAFPDPFNAPYVRHRHHVHLAGRPRVLGAG